MGVVLDYSNIRERVVMKKFIIAFSIILIFVSLPVHAGFFIDGNDLVRLMREFENAQRPNPTKTTIADAADFMGFVAGVHDVIEASGVVCSSDRVTRGQIAAVIVKFLNDNPARWNEAGYILVVDALKKAFPCKK
jgi:hypothetical protein